MSDCYTQLQVIVESKVLRNGKPKVTSRVRSPRESRKSRVQFPEMESVAKVAIVKVESQKSSL